MKKKPANAGATLKRLLAYIFKNYAFACIVVVICIFISVLANARGTMFMQSLIDDYISPMIGTKNPDFGPLAAAIGRVAIFYAAGALSAYIYTRIMVNVTQGTLRNLRTDMFTHMEKLPIK